MTQISYLSEKPYISIRQFLKEKRYPKVIIMTMKENPELLHINGKAARLSDPVSVGDKVVVTIIETGKLSDQIVPQQGKLSIIYEDEHLLVINKPHHMAIHPSVNHREMSLANIVYSHALRRNEEYPFRCINRLDRDTTGLVIVAKNRLAAAILSQDIATKLIHREYIAVCKGIFHEKEGIVDAPIGRVSGSAILRQVDFENGQHAV